MGNTQRKAPKRNDGRIIIHFDYDCFYASVCEAENPALKSLPLAVQQKQIIVTCNYEARRRGLHKLQLIKEARKVCPDVIIVLGEDLTRFRDASKRLYNFLREFSWSQKAERLGFDEVFMDVTDMIQYNVDILNLNNLPNSFFHLSRSDPTVGFSYDASNIFGHAYPASAPSPPLSPPVSTPPSPQSSIADVLHLRLALGSHLAQHLRHELEEQRGYTCTVGISTSKLLAKLVGNINKPKAQTTLVPPYESKPCNEGEIVGEESNVIAFIDTHDIGRIPNIGFKLAQKIRLHVLGRSADFDAGLVYGGTKEKVTVRDVRLFPGMGSDLLEKILGGPGAPKGIGGKVWGLVNGVDDTDVGKARSVPRQISIEDSYIRLDTMEEVMKELRMLSRNLIRRMHMDLLDHENEDEDLITLEGDPAKTEQSASSRFQKRWMAHPRTLRLTTRPRPPLNPDGTRSRTFNRISRSSPMPNFILDLTENVDSLTEKLIHEALLPLFRKLHPEKSGWNLSLVNVAATNMAEVATADGKDGGGRDIGRMFRKQESVLKEWKIEDRDVAPDDPDDSEDDNNVFRTDSPQLSNAEKGSREPLRGYSRNGSEDLMQFTQDSYLEDAEWENEEDDAGVGNSCKVCGALMPDFAMVAHERFHSIGG
ncbi:MAG: hypothetical protein M1827_005027 [Pycnora praestabilis]|nr:MAG: hypothetical protein M1827_005027 [Pycnora praestabilis]